MSSIYFFDSFGCDLRHALRGLRRRPSFSLAAVLTLALGIGATTAIFSVVYSVLIKPLPYPDAGELVRIRHPAAGLGADDLTSSSTQYLTYRDENRTLADIGLWQVADDTLSGFGEPERLRVLRVTHGTLQALGVRPMRGRWFTEAEHGPAAEGPDPVILSCAFWQRRFGGEEAALGRELSLDARPAEVVGIMPPGFRFLDMAPQPDVITAVRLDPAAQAIGIFNFQALARLAPGVTPADARADVARMLPIWLDAWPIMPGVAITREALASWRIAPVVHPLKDDLVGDVSSTLWVLMGAIGAVLLVACANIANLMLVRADARRQEFAVRAALGAEPGQLKRMFLLHGLALSGVGTAAGIIAAVVLARAMSSLLFSGGPLDPVAYAAAVTVTVLAAALASYLPARRAALIDPMETLRAEWPIAARNVFRSRGGCMEREPSRFRNSSSVAGTLEREHDRFGAMPARVGPGHLAHPHTAPRLACFLPMDLGCEDGGER